MDKDQLVIRKKTSLGSRIRRFVLLVLLWVVAIYIIAVNLCFIFGIYSDGLVVNYSLFNLSFHIYKLLGILIVGIGALITIYGVIHLRNLKRKVAHHE
ncbi:hypothetical protein [Secundilactobacillus folii]|uniref:Uncharacterized protein n=1 Tax=Secundilactobacillus folii TaxID=2678357 RepID=A0A7X3C3H8_9LACO|nr:hypothetical protein [Secundilactobacillus folii]MTV82532.1 hypothetical protein [Secundilactobacillus folii]